MNNNAVLYIKKDEEEPQLKRFIVGVRNRHRDRLFSETMIKGTDEEIKKYLNDEDKKKEIFDTIKELSDKTDDFYSSL